MQHIRFLICSFFVVSFCLGGISTYASDNSLSLSFSGSVLNSPCALSTDSENMSVDLGIMSEAYFGFQRHTNPVEFQIHLQNCVLQGAGEGGVDIDKVSVQFTSSAVDTSDPTLLANTDSAGAVNVGVRLLTVDDDPINVGDSVEMPLQVTSNEQYISFHAQAEVANKFIACTAGNVSANVTYVLNYI